MVNKEEIQSILPHIKKIGVGEINFNYSSAADMMYISFDKKQKSDKIDDRNYPTIYRYANNKLIGITIINYSSTRQIP